MARPNTAIRSLISPSQPWIYLAYLGLFFYRWLFQPPGRDELLYSLAAAAGFVALYIYAMRRRDWVVIPVAAVSVALALAFIRDNAGALVFVIFAAAMLARMREVRQRNTGLAGLGLIVLAAGLGLGYDWFYVVAVLAFGGIIGAATAWSAKREDLEAQAEDREAAAASLGAEAERRRIARDLHDLLGHSLSVIALKADLAGRLFEENPDKAREEIGAIQAVSREALREVREAVYGLRERLFTDAVNDACARLRAAGIEAEAGLECAVRDGGRQGALAMFVREATTNILRHSGASAVRISLIRDSEECVLMVEDNGCGGADPAGGGLSGLRQRLSDNGIAFQMTNVARGTRLEARFAAGDSAC